jgi:predicted nucleotidyltransferase
MAGSGVNRQRVTAVLRAAFEARPEIMFACLHGSFAAGGPFRDIDVGLWIDPTRISSEEWTRYALDLSVALQRALQAPVDVRVLNRASLAFRYHALGGALLLARDPELLAEIRARTWDDYFDFAPFARQYLREALRE